MDTETRNKLAALANMSVWQLREHYQEVFGEVAGSSNKQFLRKRVAWRIQTLAEGDLSERARRRAEDIAVDADLRIRPPRRVTTIPDSDRTVTLAMQFDADPRQPIPGTILKRLYKGQQIRTLVLHKGFEYNGKVYNSLSALAFHITGTRWNGFQFWGINRKAGNNGN